MMINILKLLGLFWVSLNPLMAHDHELHALVQKELGQPSGQEAQSVNFQELPDLSGADSFGELANLLEQARALNENTVVTTNFPEALLSWGNSSGGGEYIVDENNPWFMGNKEVVWCLDHGGEQSFSLSKAEAKKEIQKSLNDIYGQVLLRRKFGGTDELNLHLVNFLTSVNGAFETTYDYRRNDTLFIASQTRYSENCDNADLKFVLGNTESQEAKLLRDAMGDERFKRIGAMTVRTSYDSSNYWGKGFIYIAADKGPLAYSGVKGQIINFPNIWDNHLRVPKSAPVLPITAFHRFTFDANAYKLSEHIVGPLRAVVAHELGHTLGMNHTDVGVQDGGLNAKLGEFYNVMDQDFPASVIKNGFIYNGHYRFLKNFILRGTYTETMGTSWIWNFGLQGQERTIIEEILEGGSSPEKRTLKEFLGVTSLDDIQNQAFTFFLDPRYNILRPGRSYDRYLHVMSVKGDSQKYRSAGQVKILNEGCAIAEPARSYGLPQLKDYIGFGVEEPAVERSFDSDVTGGISRPSGPLVYDPNRGEWRAGSDSRPTTEVSRFSLMEFVDRNFCYEVKIAGIDYQLEFKKTYTGLKDQIILWGPDNRKWFKFFVRNDGGFDLQPYMTMGTPKYVPFFKIQYY